MNKTTLFSLLTIGALTLAACGGDDDAASDASTTVPAPIVVDQPWARATVAAQPHGAAYMAITADHDDVLVGASVASSIAGEVQIHEVVLSDESMGDDGMDMGDDESTGDDEMGDHDMGEEGDGGMAPGMIMREVDGGLPLASGETVLLEPGGYHVMLLDLVDPLEVGDEFELTLEFADSDDLTITVPVEETAP